MERHARLKADPEKTRAWQQRSRKALPQKSARRKRDTQRRAEVREEVLARDGGCTARGIAPGRCASPYPDRPPLEVHEIISRARWAAGYLEPSNCRATCQVHHDWITEHPIEAEELGLLAKAAQPGLTTPGDPS